MVFHLLIALLTLAASCCLAEWRMAQAPLKTPWADKVDPRSVLPEYPRPTMQRADWMSLNGIWQFEEARPGDALPTGRNLREVILVPFPWESSLSGIRRQLPTYTAWYRREFRVPRNWSGKRILLHFGAVDWEASVFVNGRLAGVHQGGYDPFSFDITALLQAQGYNELIVKVYDPGNSKPIACGKQANDRFSSPRGFSYCPASGIWQTVWLEPVPDIYIRSLRTVPDLDTRTVKVEVDVESPGVGTTVEVRVRDGRQIAGEAAGSPGTPLTVSIPSPKPWSPESPHLYTLEVALTRHGKIVDAIRSYFGMRKIAIRRYVVNGRDGLMKIELNNRFLFQMGVLDQGYWPDGIYTAPSDDAVRWEIEQVKRAGYNMVRKHIKVEPERWYYWCDRLGLLVWQDMPSTFKKRNDSDKIQFEAELQRMVKSRWNHPSIVNWIVFNEHWGAYDVERLTSLVMALDPSRLVTGNSGIDAGQPDIDYEVGHIKDNHHYRPPTNPTPTNRRAAVNGEYGAIGYKAPGHIWDADGPWVHDTYKGLEDATAEYEKFISMLLRFRNEDHLSGAVYTQWTDVENEMNGIYTYDRKRAKLNLDRVSAANRSTWEGPN